MTGGPGVSGLVTGAGETVPGLSAPAAVLTVIRGTSVKKTSKETEFNRSDIKDIKGFDLSLIPLVVQVNHILASSENTNPPSAYFRKYCAFDSAVK